MWRRGALIVVVACALPGAAAAQGVTLKLPPSASEQAAEPDPPPIAPAEPAPSPTDPFVPPAMLPPDEVITPIAPPMPRPKPKLVPKLVKVKVAPGEMAPVDDIPGGKLYKVEPGKAPLFRCFVRDVMAFYDRTHVRCYNKARGKLNFFAVDTNQPVSATVLEKGLAAMQSGKPVTLSFAPDADLNPSNCDRANCRRLIDIKE